MLYYLQYAGVKWTFYLNSKHIMEGQQAHLWKRIDDIFKEAWKVLYTHFRYTIIK
jgi:hypothetical protein